MSISKRVLFFSHSAARAGATKSLQLLMQGLKNNGIELAVVMPPGPAVNDYRISGLDTFIIPDIGYLISTYGSKLKGVRLIAYIIRYFVSAIYNKKISSIIDKFQPCIVHCNEFGMFNIAKLAKKRNIKVVMHTRTPISYLPRWYRKWAKSQVTKYVDCVVAIDGSVMHSLKGIADNTIVVYNPLPMLSLNKPNSSSKLREGGKVHVSFLSGLLPLKGIWDMIDAAYLLRERNDIVFDIYGENLRKRNFLDSLLGKLLQKIGLIFDMENEIRQKINILNLDSVIMHGYVTDIYEAIQKTDILLFPSHLNGPGRSVFEAGMCGVPSIVAMIDRVQDIVVDDLTGIIVREKSPDELAAAILRLVDDPQLRMRLGKEAEKKYSKQFDITNACKAIIKIYESVNSTNC